MKITKQALQKIIKEEYTKIMIQRELQNQVLKEHMERYADDDLNQAYELGHHAGLKKDLESARSVEGALQTGEWSQELHDAFMEGFDEGYEEYIGATQYDDE